MCRVARVVVSSSRPAADGLVCSGRVRPDNKTMTGRQHCAILAREATRGRVQQLELACGGCGADPAIA